MTHTHMTDPSISMSRNPRWRNRLGVAVGVVGALAALGACSDTNVPFYTAPTSVALSPAGIQNAVSGIFAASRNDIGTFVTTVAAGYARDGAVFTNTEARTVEYPLGVFPTPTTSGSIWGQEFQNIVQAHETMAALPKVAPAYTSAQLAALNGMLQTMVAYNYMLMAEAHDTLGVAIMGSDIASTPPQGYCNKDVWAYIVAVLDSANSDLTTAGSTTIPLKLPTGFRALSTAGPSTTSGTFASLNRALAAKANLELAYAIARTPPNTAPSVTSAGSPDPGALTTAMADLTASAMYNPAELAPDPSGGFTAGPFAVTHDYSANSGDLVNPINGESGTLAQLNDFVVAVDTVNDLRWKAKFGPNPNKVQQQLYNPVASTYIETMYPGTNSPIPIVREVQLVLWHAQILIGQGNYAGALADINLVRTTAGGPALTPYPGGDAGSYVSVRNDLLKEQRISTTWEASADRTISLRMYGLAAAADTTWGANGVLPHGGTEDPSVKVTDSHTTVNPVPFSELTARGGTFSLTCK
jgi:starch-binding outer membrane protein, SusD/RagB family